VVDFVSGRWLLATTVHVGYFLIIRVILNRIGNWTTVTSSPDNKS